MRRIGLQTIVVAVLATILAACVPEFENPVQGGTTADPRLIGTWTATRSDEPDDTATVAISKDGDGVTIAITEADPDANPRTQRFSALSARIGGVSYLNVRSVDDDLGPRDAYILLRYVAAGDRIEVHGLIEEKIEAAIADGLLTGAMAPQGVDKTPRITSSSAELAAFLASPAGQAAFKAGDDDALILTRKTP